MYENRDYNQTDYTGWSTVAAKLVSVDLLNSAHALLATTVTNAEGFFSKDVAELEIGHDYQVRVNVLSVVGRVRVGVLSQEVFSAVAPLRTASSSNEDAGTWVITAATWPSVRLALNVHDALYQGYTYAAERFGAPPASVQVVMATLGPYYDQLVTGLMYIPASRADNDDVVLHEYGHFLWDNYTDLRLPGGDHEFCEPSSDERQAFSEGWGQYWAAVVKGRPWTVGQFSYEDTGSQWLDLETGRQKQNTRDACVNLVDERSALFEGAIAAVLWDLRDADGGESFDTVSNERRIYEFIRGAGGSTGLLPPTILDLRLAWGNDAEIDPILCHHAGQFCADGDGDGVFDGADLCPNTSPGADVDAHGCSSGQLGLLPIGPVTLGQVITFTWTNNDSPLYELVVNGGPGVPFAGALIGTFLCCEVSFVLPPSVSRGDYAVFVRGGGVASLPIVVTVNAPPIELMTPTTGEALHVGAQTTFAWTSQAQAGVTQYLFRVIGGPCLGPSGCAFIVAGTVWPVTIPNGIQTGNYALAVQGCLDSCGALLGDPSPTITVSIVP